MKKLLFLTIVIGGLLGTGLSVQSAEPLAEKEFVPSERLSDGSIKGTLTRTEGEYYFIKGLDGIEKKIHVDKSTQSEKVHIGDIVRASVTDQGHTTALTVVKAGNGN